MKKLIMASPKQNAPNVSSRGYGKKCVSGQASDSGWNHALPAMYIKPITPKTNPVKVKARAIFVMFINHQYNPSITNNNLWINNASNLQQYLVKCLCLIHIKIYKVNIITKDGFNMTIKKKVMGMFMVGAIAVLGLAPAQSASAFNPAQTEITGVITDAGVPVNGADVTVKCGATTKTDTTDAFGSYRVTFTMAECPPGSIAKVTAKKGTKSGTNSGVVVGVTTKLNLALVNVDIPEYGLIGGMLAAGAGVGAIIFTRRRYSQQGLNL